MRDGVTMSYFDEFETRSVDQRDADLAARLPQQIGPGKNFHSPFGDCPPTEGMFICDIFCMNTDTGPGCKFLDPKS